RILDMKREANIGLPPGITHNDVPNDGDCFICQRPLQQDDQVIDHDHFTGAIRGLAHKSCNLQYQESKKIPVLFHNLKNYDSHLLMQKVGCIRKRRISCIAHTLEKYMTVKIGRLQFLDSFQFMPESLAKLVDNLKRSGEENFSILRHYYPDDQQRQLLLRKGVFPYEYLDSWEKFREVHIPAQEDFYNRLTEDTCSDKDYAHVRNVYQTFNLHTFGDYHDLYLECDVLQLADVCENFRRLSRDKYGLEPFHKYTSPGLSWLAGLKMTGVKLELITDPAMHLMVERGIRGGLCGAYKRLATANNPLAPENCDANKPTSWILYLDANNLYGWAMVQKLPVGSFRWVIDEELRSFDPAGIDPEGNKGYFLEVDLEYPRELHDQHADFPLAAEMMAPTADKLPAHLQHLAQNENAKKLLPTMWDKSAYVLHIKQLQFYLQQGLRLKTIHRVMEFEQSDWLRRYIEFNTEQRRQAKNEFEKMFFKLMNNSFYGKTLEKVRDHKEVKLVNTVRQLTRWTAKGTFRQYRAFGEDLVGVEVARSKIVMNR